MGAQAFWASSPCWTPGTRLRICCKHLDTDVHSHVSQADGQKNPAIVARILKYHNDLRAQHGTPPLRWSGVLAKSAQVNVSGQQQRIASVTASFSDLPAIASAALRMHRRGSAHDTMRSKAVVPPTLQHRGNHSYSPPSLQWPMLTLQLPVCPWHCSVVTMTNACRTIEW